jgi:chromosome segregation ATPase|tara:strand:- start:84 stop:500 length:417 start_codon:yes stop_codon:yes gene_type:complete
MNAEIKKLEPHKQLKLDNINLRRDIAELRVVADGNKAIIEDLVKDNFDLKEKKDEAEEALANALAGDHRQKEADDLMMSKLERIQELESINESHKQINGDLRREITTLEQEKLEVQVDNKKLARQIEDSLDRLRKSGM